MKQLAGFFRNFRYIPRTLRIITRAAKRWTATWAFLLILQSILPTLTVLITPVAVNNLLTTFDNGAADANLPSAIAPMLLFIMLIIIEQFIGKLMQWVRLGQSETVRDYISGLIQEQSNRLDLSYFEDKDYYDLFHRVYTQARNYPILILENIGTFIRSSLILLGMGITLMRYDWWLLPLLIIGAVPAVIGIIRFGGEFTRWRKSVTFEERKTAYYDIILTDRIPAPEVRLFSLSEYYMGQYKAARRSLRYQQIGLYRKKMLLELIALLFAMGSTGTVVIWMGWRVLQGLATVGTLAALYQILIRAQDAVSAVSSHAGEVYQSVLFLEDLFTFLDLQPTMPDQAAVSAPRLSHEIRFEHVSFRYPGSERYALEDFSLTIPAGKIVAIVGENGVGKTTLTKLICRFFDPNEGRITWDGHDLRQLQLSSLQRQITMLFQSPFFYPETVAQNIALGDLSAAPSQAAIEAAAKASGAHEMIMGLPQQYETPMHKWLGGEELSIGEWQRLALARAFVRNSSLIMLDEPTSAMDAWAEMQWVNRLRQLAEGKSLLMITHRFTTAMQADLIFVFYDHQIREEGTHSELLALNGRYAESWHTQMRGLTEL